MGSSGGKIIGEQKNMTVLDKTMVTVIMREDYITNHEQDLYTFNYSFRQFFSYLELWDQINKEGTLIKIMKTNFTEQVAPFK